ncbi:hypothetical protein [uncultured Microscilla sp.]|uniref:hypothetical protein n=1 Tax=uncultured Microscilla sp. TaxID=432653 RepID=UPI00262F034F|nr:hypothetical protein [uncultured Microscilla sp.]
MANKVVLLEYPQANKNKLNKYQKANLKKIRKGILKQCSLKLKMEIQPLNLNSIDLNHWNLVFCDFHKEEFEKLSFKDTNFISGGVFFMKSNYTWLQWQSDDTYKQPWLAGFMGSQGVALLSSSSFRNSLGYKVYAYAFVGVKDVLQNTPGYVKGKWSMSESCETFFDEGTINTENKDELKYVLHDLDSIYTRVSVNMESFTKIFFAYLDALKVHRSKSIT